MPYFLSLYNVFITQRYPCSMKNADFDVGNADWRALASPKFDTWEKCQEWCETQPVANAFVWVEDLQLCLPKTGTVKIKALPPDAGLTTWSGVVPCP